MLAYPAGDDIRLRSVAKQVQKNTLPVHQEQIGAVKDRVCTGYALIAGLYAIGDIKSRRRRVDLLLRPGEPDKLRPKSMNISCDCLDRIVFPVDADKQRLYLRCIVSKLMQRISNFNHGGRADIRTLRETEKDQAQATVETVFRNLISVVVKQLEVAANNVIGTGFLSGHAEYDRA